MHLTTLRRRQLRFDDGTPVRAASGVAPYLDGHLVVQDDATHAAHVRAGSTQRLRVFPPVDGHDVFDAAAGTKHLKPDLEAAVALGHDRVLLLGSGSTSARTRVALVGPDGVAVRDLPELYGAVGDALGTPAGTLNLEGACLVGDRLRWFQRGAAGLPSASVDLVLDDLVGAVLGSACPVVAHDRRTYDLGEVDGVALGVTDAVTVPDGRVLVSAAAEDTPNPVDDGPVVAAALLLLDGVRVVGRALPPDGDRVLKVEGLALLEDRDREVVVVAVVDDDDARTASTELVLRVVLPD